MKIYEKYMKKCIKLARKGEGKTSPNPLVGCIVLDENGIEISEGFHEKYGEYHAERNALLKLSDEQAKGATLIVNLEPCSHQGKTPPCADLIIEKGIKKLIVGMKDPNPIVSGKGIEKCKNAGIEVFEGVLENETKELNEVFIKDMKKKALFVAIKTATTLDGKIATKTGDSKWITSAASRKEVQIIRNRYDAILTTSSTIIKDNPSMTCRLKNGKNPVKIILDRELKTDYKAKIYSTSGEKIYIVTDEKQPPEKIKNIPQNISLIKCPSIENKLDLKKLFKQLYNLGIKSVLIEAGGTLCGEIVSLDLADKIYQFIAPKILADSEGKNAFKGRDIQSIKDTINFKIVDVKNFSPDILIVYKKNPVKS